MAAVFIALVFAFVLAQDPKSEIVKKDKVFCSLYNSQDFEGLAKQYHPDALLITPAPDHGFLKQTQIAMFFNQTYQSGLHPLNLVPDVVEKQGSVLHEIGIFNGMGRYYVRWIPDSEAGWLIAFDCMAIGAHSVSNTMNLKGGRSSKKQQEDPKVFLSKIYEDFISKVNSGDVEGAYELLMSEDSRAIFTDGKSLNDRDTTIAGVKASNFTMTSSQPMNVFAENSNLWHEIGQSAYVVNGLNVQNYYYSRWERQDEASPWQSTFSIDGIGQ